jgi:hypothetical protein
MLGPTPSKVGCLNALAPAGDLRIADESSVFQKKQMPMVDFTG